MSVAMIVVISMLVAALMQMLRLRLVRVIVRIRNQFCDLAPFEHMDFGAGDAAAVYLLNAQRGVEREGYGCLVQHLGWHAGVKQCAEKHVSRDAGVAVEIGDAHKMFPLFPVDE